MLPRPVYEFAPLVYSCVGITSIIEAHNTLGRLSGAMLLSASMIIFTLRRVYRSS